MSRVLLPVTADRLCLALTHRSMVHCSDVDVIGVWRLMDARPGEIANMAVRTACGSDAFMVFHRVGFMPADEPPAVMAAPWPPPRRHRCTDCATVVPPRRDEMVRGSHHWRELVGDDDRWPA